VQIKGNFSMNVREWALPVYTILLQLAIGALIGLWVLRWVAGSKFGLMKIDRIVRNPIVVIAFTAMVSMAAAHFHLSRPFQSFLAVLNFKSSWLSREIVFSIFFMLMTIGLVYLIYFRAYLRRWISALGWVAILVGLVLIYCMAHIYILPTQVAWNSTTVVISFYITSLMLGANALTCLMVLDLKFAEIQKADDVELRVQLIKYALAGLTILTVVLVILSILITYFQMYLLSQGKLIAITSLQLLTGLYLPLLILRQIMLVVASLLLIAATYRIYKLQATPQALIMPVYASCLLIIIGEIIGRFLFYATHIRVGL
jgi:anaerobic dimethyl sulfoxide reductase subunit C